MKMLEVGTGELSGLDAIWDGRRDAASRSKPEQQPSCPITLAILNAHPKALYPRGSRKAMQMFEIQSHPY